MVLTKIDSEVVRQPDTRVRCAWYQSVTAEVLLQHDAENGTFLSFEIDWETRGFERAYVTWVRGAGLRTGRVDTGEEGSFRYKASPVVIWDFRVREDLIPQARRLIERSCIEEGLRESILKRLVL